VDTSHDRRATQPGAVDHSRACWSCGRRRGGRCLLVGQVRAQRRIWPASWHEECFGRCGGTRSSWRPRAWRRRGVVSRQDRAVAGSSCRALCRTRTGDPFLTIAVRRLSAVPDAEPKCLQVESNGRLAATALIRTLRHSLVPRGYLRTREHDARVLHVTGACGRAGAQAFERVGEVIVGYRGRFACHGGKAGLLARRL
jgi:hypothetical protein